MHTAVARQFGDHPRGCGEHYGHGVALQVREGSSPRMRGARRILPLWHCRYGIIPADAGSTAKSADAGDSQRDHPRGCGEHRAEIPVKAVLRGSSPRMRGALLAGALVTTMRRIIPADAGSTRASHKPRSNRQDHPRGCGEHATYSCRAQRESGSSPRMRGAQATIQPMPTLRRIIPADAGST